MHVLTVLDHPDPNSFSSAVAAAFGSGARASGHTVEQADLHAEGFSPLWSMADIAPESEATDLPDLIAEQERIQRADAICLVFPLYWWGMPAMMKGWVDRVFRWGWAYDQLHDPNISCLRPRSGLLLVPAAASSERISAGGYDRALEAMWMQGTFGYFGMNPRKLELLCGSEGAPERRAALLDRSYRCGVELADPAASCD